MKKNVWYLILFMILVVTGYLLINYPTTVGLADNCDFGRVIQPVGLASDENDKYFYAQQDFAYDREFNSFSEYIKFIINPGIHNISGYKSTHSVIVNIAQVINGVVKYYRYNKIYDFDIRAMSILYLMLISFGIVLLIKGFHFKNILFKILLSAVIIFIYFDKGYLVYFNSFFGEPLILVSLLIYIGSMLCIINKKEDKYVLYIVNFIAGCIFIGAKVANIPLGILMIIFSGLLFYYKRDNKIRALIVMGSLCMLVTSVYYYVSVPKWMGDVNKYHSLFYGVLKDSDNPEEDLSYLGIDEKYSALQGTHGYMDHNGFDIYSDEFREEVYEKATPMKISLYYLTHPDRLMEKMKLSAVSSTIIRPPYLGNYNRKDYDEGVKFDESFSLWEKLRKTAYESAFFIILVIFILFIITTILVTRRNKARGDKKRNILPIAFRVMIILFAGSQFILPVIGNGEADLIKHMFLFNVLLDLTIILMAADILKLLERKKYKPVAFITGFVIICIVSSIVMNVGDKNKTMVFGKYNDEDIVWEVLDETDDYYFVASNDVIEVMKFNEDNSNLWIDSDIRKWLNNDTEKGFLYEFQETEKDKIINTPIKTILSPDKNTLIEEGNRPHYWYCIPGYITQNVDEAYSSVNNERVFILGVKDYDEYVESKKKSRSYWLRTPYTNSRFVRVVGLDGFTYHKEANTSSIGIVPCMYIKK